jgi:hypothetical protein
MLKWYLYIWRIIQIINISRNFNQIRTDFIKTLWNFETSGLISKEIKIMQNIRFLKLLLSEAEGSKTCVWGGIELYYVKFLMSFLCENFNTA